MTVGLNCVSLHLSLSWKEACFKDSESSSIMTNAALLLSSPPIGACLRQWHSQSSQEATDELGTEWDAECAIALCRALAY